MIRVLIVDDSAFARKVLKDVLSRDAEIEVVGIARDGLEALEKIAELKPDVVTLDLVMPDLDGLGVLRALQTMATAPQVIVVSVSGRDADLAIEALEYGAFDLITKPTPLPTDRLYEMSSGLVLKVKAAARSEKRSAPLFENPPGTRAALTVPSKTSPVRLVVIGTSTGGPQALGRFFKLLPEDFPVPIAVALHIPEGYTAPLAARISLNSAVSLSEAFNGAEFKAGHALIAPGGMHLCIEVGNGAGPVSDRPLVAKVSKEPKESLYHPSVDLLFESAAVSAGAGVIAIVLTGMGNDGTAGARKIRAAGGTVFTESEPSCVVYGMPRSVFEANLSNGQASLDNMAKLLVQHLKNSLQSGH